MRDRVGGEEKYVEPVSCLHVFSRSPESFPFPWVSGGVRGHLLRLFHRINACTPFVLMGVVEVETGQKIKRCTYATMIDRDRQTVFISRICTEHHCICWVVFRRTQTRPVDWRSLQCNLVSTGSFSRNNQFLCTPFSCFNFSLAGRWSCPYQDCQRTVFFLRDNSRFGSTFGRLQGILGQIVTSLLSTENSKRQIKVVGWAEIYSCNPISETLVLGTIWRNIRATLSLKLWCWGRERRLGTANDVQATTATLCSRKGQWSGNWNQLSHTNNSAIAISSEL
jgi:hypothetical protein